ncbi:hypothetical protein L9F63_002691, partial [Diploptera punctata]
MITADTECKRSQSVDIPYNGGGDHSVSSSDCDLQNETSLRTLPHGTRRKNKLAARFPLFGDCCTDITNTEKSQPVYNHNAGLDEGFGATYTLPKSDIFENLTSEPLGRAWTEEELRECCKELGIENSYINKFELESLESDYSNDLSTSEKSLGEQIIAMAQDIKTSETHSRLPLEPGLESKPPLPHNYRITAGSAEKSKNTSNSYSCDKIHDRLFEKFTCEYRNSNKKNVHSKSFCSLDRYHNISHEPNNDQLFNSNIESRAFLRNYILPEGNLVDSNENDVQFITQSSADNILGNDFSNTDLEVEYFNKPYNSKITLETREQRIFDCDNTEALCSEQNITNNFKKDKTKELHLECLIEEDTNGETKIILSTARSNKSDKSHTTTSASICEIQTMEAASLSNNSQKNSLSTEQNTTILEKTSVNTKTEEKSSHQSTSVEGEHAPKDTCTAAEVTGNTTYDDIVTILKVLEQEEQNNICELLYYRIKKNQLDSTQKELMADGKLRDILIYLDEIELCNDATLESAKNQLQQIQDSTRNAEIKMTSIPKLEELLKMSTSDLAHEILTLRLQLEEKNSSINLLQETLQQQRELTVCNMKNADRDIKNKLRKQKEEYEATVCRHQKFIDQLIADKKCLNDKCQKLVLELKKSEEHHVSTLKTVEERHKIELQKAREMHAAAEKLRRERWIDNKTQKIKEMTVKGLEPELQRLNTRHQQELADLRMLHKQELDELELRAARKTAQQIEQLRDQLNAEKEETVLKEKEILRQ